MTGTDDDETARATARAGRVLHDLAEAWIGLHSDRAPGSAPAGTVRWVPAGARAGAGESRPAGPSLAPIAAPARVDVLDVLRDTALIAQDWEGDLRDVLGLGEARRRDRRARDRGAAAPDLRVVLSIAWTATALPAAAEKDPDAPVRIGREAGAQLAAVRRLRGLLPGSVNLAGLECPLCRCRSLVATNLRPAGPGRLDGLVVCMNAGGCACGDDDCETEPVGRPHAWPAESWPDLADWFDAQDRVMEA